MTTNGRNVRIRNRSRIAAQNLMEGDEFLMRGAPNIHVMRISRSELCSVMVTFDTGTTRRFEWDDRVSITETPDRHRYRRNSLRRNGYKNYLAVRAKTESPIPTPKRKPKRKRPTR